ncbi:MAG: Ni/Fe hydrogenase subunit alpha [Gemmatimonadetes bacterium]|nr:Ni/Fe hydrogenase subunit alpha [Gemmatimonadota bacterium]
MSRRDLHVDVHHITRVEGHGNLVIDVDKGELKKCELQIVESPRYFEVLLEGRPYTEVHHIAGRICGICSIGHTLSSIQATERAFGIEATEQTLLLRRLLHYGEMIQSHALHAFFLVLPDLFNADSVIPLAADSPDLVQRALRIKRFANDLCAVLAGRHIHPISPVVGGWTSLPDPAALEDLARRLDEEIRDDLTVAVDALAGLPLPALDRPTENVALVNGDRYPLLSGEIGSSIDPPIVPADYLDKIEEKVNPHSSAKHCEGGHGPFMVGALSRWNLNGDKLRPEALAVAESLALPRPCDDPYRITHAQIVEAVDMAYDSGVILARILDEGLVPETVRVEPRAGRGVGAVEVPRGLLIHDYTYGDDGRVEKANCIIPTGMNLANIEADLRAAVPRLLDLSEKRIEHELQMLVRAYDPCISCSTHLLNVVFE